MPRHAAPLPVFATEAPAPVEHADATTLGRSAHGPHPRRGNSVPLPAEMPSTPSDCWRRSARPSRAPRAAWPPRRAARRGGTPGVWRARNRSSPSARGGRWSAPLG